jgi:hypothetical protein
LHSTLDRRRSFNFFTNYRSRRQSHSPNCHIGANDRICVAPRKSWCSATPVLKKKHFSVVSISVPKNAISHSRCLHKAQSRSYCAYVRISNAPER